jgi:hypothetical protein
MREHLAFLRETYVRLWTHHPQQAPDEPDPDAGD